MMKNKDSFHNLQELVANWQNKTFGKNNIHISGIIEHLKKEIKELRKSIKDINTQAKEPARYHANIASELADCEILLIGLADAFNVDLYYAVEQKMNENVKRKWKKPNKYGVIEHQK